MKAKLILTLILTTLIFSANAQDGIVINAGINLPKDSLQAKELVNSVNLFLSKINFDNLKNEMVSDFQKLETFVLLDEMKNIEMPGRFSFPICKAYLNNIIQLNDYQYGIQLSYMGTKDNTPFLRANFYLIASHNGKSFSFASPLSNNTTTWKTIKTDNTVFHFKNTLNNKKIKDYCLLVSSFDKKLRIKNFQTEFYCCDNLVEAGKLLGMDYKADYNGRRNSVLSSLDSNRSVVLLANKNDHFDNFDLHDLWHDRLSLVVDRSKTNRAVDEGCAYLYGGSWGLTWAEIFKSFKEQVASNRNINWEEVKEKPVYFKTNNYNNSADYIVNALLIQKIEKEKGFSSVMELLKSGPAVNGNAPYYKILEKIVGISRDKYNATVWKLIENEK